MGALTRLGRILFGIAMAGIGVQHLIYSNFLSDLEPVPASLPGRVFLAYLTGIVLLVAGVSILANMRAVLGAIAVGLLFLLSLLLIHLWNLGGNLRDGNAWTVASETVALCGAAWVLAGVLAREQPAVGRWERLANRGADPGRVLFGLSLPVFGILHFIYAKFVATLVPAWMPERLFVAYFTGAAFCAAGLAIVTRVKGQLAATLLGIMFALFVLTLHLPRVVEGAHARSGWTSLFIAIAMSGASLLVAAALAKDKAVREV